MQGNTEKHDSILTMSQGTVLSFLCITCEGNDNEAVFFQ